MKILVIGSGGREHAVCAKFCESEKVEKVFAAPGNAGMSEIAECVTDLDVKNHAKTIDFCKNKQIDLVFVGPEQPLVDGIVDDLKKAGIKVFGPSKFAAQLEGSKEFMKKIAVDRNVPTAKYETFVEFEPAFSFAKELGFPCVVKTDGLAAGKGVYIVENEEHAKNVIQEFFDGKFGEASKKIIIEEFLSGVEISYFAVCDGENFVSLGSACDHKKVGEGETGLNTGGMGVFAPSPFVDEKIESEIVEKMIKPTLKTLKDLGGEFVGVLFAGIIITEDGPKLLEYNVRFGDPETQLLLPRVKSDFCDLILAAVDRKLGDFEVEFDDEKYVGVVICAKGYPESYEKGLQIKNLDAVKNLENVFVLHAGTKLDGDKVLSNGGRVLNVAAKAESFKKARELAYEAVDLIDFEGGFCRRDIAKRVEGL